MAQADDARVLDLLERLVADLVLDAEGGVRDLGRMPPFVRPKLVREHALHPDIVAAVGSHPVLRALIPSADQPPRWVSGFEPELLAERLLNAALWHCSLGRRLTASCLSTYFSAAIESVQRLIANESIDVPVHVGFGAELPPGVVIETPWGRLEPWRPEHEWLLSGLEPGPGRGTVLESSTTVRTNIVPTNEPGTIYSVGLEDERWRRLALALLLAQDPADARPTPPWFCTQAQVLGHGMGSGAYRQFLKGPLFGVDQLGDLERWMRMTANPSLSIIAVDRIVGMTTRLVDHVDAFIDAVIVWENLFGTGDQQELSYRVSTNMACILTDTPRGRVAMQEEIKQLYNLRSKVVHGGKHLTGAEAVATRQRAQVLTLTAAARLLENHPHLVGARQKEFMAFVLGVATEDR